MFSVIDGTVAIRSSDGRVTSIQTIDTKECIATTQFDHPQTIEWIDWPTNVPISSGTWTTLFSWSDPKQALAQFVFRLNSSKVSVQIIVDNTTFVSVDLDKLANFYRLGKVKEFWFRPYAGSTYWIVDLPTPILPTASGSVQFKANVGTRKVLGGFSVLVRRLV